MANMAFVKDVYGDNHELIYVTDDSVVLDDGQVVVAQALSTVDDEGDVYQVTTPVAVTDEGLAIVVAEEYYEDDYGNRVNITDPTKISYAVGSVVRAVRPNVGRKIAVSAGAVGTGTPTVGEYLIPTAGSRAWTATDTVGTAKLILVVEYVGNVSFKGHTPITGVVARVVLADQI